MPTSDLLDVTVGVHKVNLQQPRNRSRSAIRKVALPKLRMKKPVKEPETPVKERKQVPAEKSFSIGLKYYTLPENYPGRFASYSVYKNTNGEKVPLLHRDIIERTLVELDKELQPILKKFGLFYAALSENHPTRGKAAMTYRIPVKFYGPNAFAHHIKLRLRSSKHPNDPKKFYNKSTLLAVMFHELAHIKHMHHGKKFMLFLRDIYRYATNFRIFPKNEAHLLPSCHAWENLIFKKKGQVSNETLLELYASSK